jgi:hypothetical protein
MKEQNTDFFARPSTQKALWRLLYGLCALVVLAELFAAPKAHFAFGKFFGFHALLGLVSCAVLIVVAKGLDAFIKRREDYYDG